MINRHQQHFRKARPLHKASFSAFTLIEIMIALGLLAIIAGAVLISARPILDGYGEGNILGQPPIEEVFRRAVRQARYHAAASKQPATLRFDVGSSNFIIESKFDPPEDEPDRENAIKSVYKTGYAPEDPELKVTLYQLLPGRASQQGNIFEPDTEETNRIVFHPDRSSTPFEVLFEDGFTQIRQRYDLFSDGILSEDRRK